MALKKDAIDNFFQVSQKYASAKRSPVYVSVDDEISSFDFIQTRHKPDTKPTRNFPTIPSSQGAGY
jgi:hypothetical protein